MTVVLQIIGIVLAFAIMIYFIVTSVEFSIHSNYNGYFTTLRMRFDDFIITYLKDPGHWNKKKFYDGGGDSAYIPYYSNDAVDGGEEIYVKFATRRDYVKYISFMNKQHKLAKDGPNSIAVDRFMKQVDEVYQTKKGGDQIGQLSQR